MNAKAIETGLKSLSEGPESFDTWLGHYCAAMGEDSDSVRKTIEEARAESLVSGDWDSLVKAVKGYTVPKGIANTLADRIRNFQTKHAGYSVTLVVSVDSDSVSIAAHKRKIRATKDSGEVSAKSRKSAFTAYQEGQKAGDTFKVIRHSRTDWEHDSGERFKSCLDLIRKLESDSAAAEILRKYGAKL